MIKKGSKLSLAEKISSVLNAAPETLDPEDQQDDTTAKLTSLGDDLDEEGNEDDVEKLLSKFRKQNVDLLADVDQKYAGKKSSRRIFRDSDESDEQDQSEEEQEDDKDLDQSDDSEEIEQIDQPSEDEFDNSEEENDDDAGDSDSGSGSIDPFEETEGLQKNDANFKHIKETNALSQVNKGLAVRNQMGIWENLLEIRIQLQKMMLAANKMPQKDYYKEIKKESGIDFTNRVEETKENIISVLHKMMIYQKTMVKDYPETKNLVKNKKSQKVKVNEDTDDEEIPSDTDEEDLKSDSDNEEHTPPLKKRKLDELETDLNEFHNTYKDYRNSTIEKWNTKTRLSVTKNSGETHSVVQQIDHILTDKEKLLKKTHLNRTGFKIVAPEKDENEEIEEDNNEEYNAEIFDDTDFYHQLLRELIEVKSADVTDPVQLGRQWIQLQNLRSKMKKKVDTKASKGRKIRYAVHTKLVNFMAPFDNYSWTNEAKNELFGSLFGKSQPKVVPTK